MKAYSHSLHPKLPVLDVYSCLTVAITAPDGSSLSTQLTAEKALALAEVLVRCARAEIHDLKHQKPRQS